MKSELFVPKTRKTIEQTVIALLNGNQLMNYNTVNSPRAVGDAVQGFLEKNIEKCLPQKLVAKINTSFARRSMADLAFEDVTGNYYVVDIKTHNLIPILICQILLLLNGWQDFMVIIKIILRFSWFHIRQQRIILHLKIVYLFQ
jgi:hypothetical protein